MKAMIFAAGLGTRLRSLTDDRPKALVTVCGRTLLEITIERLRRFGVDEVIVNAHHFAEQIVAYLAANSNFGMRIEVSREEDLLDTGGGLKKAAWFFLESDAGKGEPFIVHNVDVLSMVDLGRMVEFHRQHSALATLAVQERDTSRPLLFDAGGRLVRRGAARDELGLSQSPKALERLVKESDRLCGQPVEPLAFCGIHVVSPRIFAKLDEAGAFSIVDSYVRLAAQGESILAYRADGAYWRDLGRTAHLAEAERDVADGTYAAN